VTIAQPSNQPGCAWDSVSGRCVYLNCHNRSPCRGFYDEDEDDEPMPQNPGGDAPAVKEPPGI
jgi:hypothetical protein